MTERYGPLFAAFIEPDDPTHAIVHVNYEFAMGGIVRADVTRKLGQAQRGRMTIEKTTGWDQFVVEGRICALFQGDHVLDAEEIVYRPMGAFLVQSVREKLDGKGREIVEVSGLGPEHLLTKVKLWEPVGSETVIATTLDVTAVAPWTTTVAVGCPTGNDSVSLTSDAGLEDGDEIRIQMNNGSWYVGKVTSAEPPGMPAGVVQMQPRIVGDADIGNNVELRKARLTVDDATGLAAEQQVVVTLNSGTLETVIDEVDTSLNVVVVRTGLPSAANSGNALTAYDYSEPATDDVTQVIGKAAQWAARFQISGAVGSVAGTAHTPVGESVFDLLNTIAEQTGEMWRFDDLLYGYVPRKQIYWAQLWDVGPPSLYLRASSSDVAADTENVNRAVVYTLEREKTSDIITRIFPVAADGRIDLSYCTPSLVASAAVQGFTVVNSSDLYRPDYVEYGPGVTTYGVQEATFRFANVTLAKKAKFAELRQAADAMLYQAMSMIHESQGREFWRARVHSHRPIYPGQALELYNQTGVGPGTANTYFVLEVKDSYDEGGVIMTDLRLAATPYMEKTALRSLGNELKATQMASRRVAGDGSTTAAAAVVPGSGGDHGALTGLADDDHPQYLLANGTRSLMGNLAVGTGMTVDGVDISAHAANPAAHHALVTAADASMTVSGQAIRIADAAAGDGLGLTSGVLAVKTAVGNGTGIFSDTVGVYVAAEGGLEVGSTGVGIKRPGNSGIGLSSLGASLVPATVGAGTANANIGNEHTHAVESAEDSKTTPGRLMKASADGDHALRYLTADRVQTPLVLSGGDLTIDPGSGVLSVDGNLTFTGGGRSVTTASGDLTLAPAGELQFDPASNVAEVQPSVTLKTSHWSSGFLGTGWGLSYDGHLDTRSIYADELHVAAFIADTARVAVGSEYITPGMAILAEDFTVPAVAATGTLVVEDAPGLPNMAVFDSNDWVLLRVMNRAGGGLLVANVWGQVAGYADGPGAGQQSWTFTTKSTTAAGQVVAGGSVALGFGKSGAGWWWVTAIDQAGSPYAGISTWQGTDPYTEGNRSHVLRMGQLKGVTGVHEWGLYAGRTTSRRLRFSDLASEIHGTRLSLYAGDGAQLRVAAVEVRLYRDGSNYVTLVPTADHTAVNVVSSGGSYFGQIDEGVASYSAADYVANGPNTSGVLFVGLTDPSPWGAVAGATVRAGVAGSGFSNDTVALYAQVFASDETTPLTAERLVTTLTGNTSLSVEGSFQQVDAGATQTQWNGARLRLRWEYTINSSEEAIRLDPQVPSIAVGATLPTGYTAGGDGFWVGSDGGTYKMRVGKASGVGLRWTGSAVELRNSSGVAVIELDSSGNSRFAGPMTIGTSGGIWQGTGTFGSPTTGLKIWNDGGVGRLATYSGGSPQIAIDTSGRLVAGETTLSSAGMQIRSSSLPSTPINFLTYVSGVNYANVFSYSDGTGAITGLRSWRPGNLVNMGYLALHTNSVEGDKVQMAIGSAGGVSNILEVRPGSTDSNKSVRVLGGLLVGSVSIDAPGEGVVRIKQRTAIGGSPAATFVDFFAVDDGSGQKLYVKFANGATRLLASA